jgi:hypothetical protein
MASEPKSSDAADGEEAGPPASKQARAPKRLGPGTVLRPALAGAGLLVVLDLAITKFLG